MKKVVYLAVEFKDELDLVDNIIKAAMEAEDAVLDKDGVTARHGEIQVGKEPTECIHFDLEIGESEDVSLCNLFPDEITDEPIIVHADGETLQGPPETEEIPVVTGDAEVATAELAIA